MTGVNIASTTEDLGELRQCLLKKAQISGEGWLFSSKGATVVIMSLCTTLSRTSPFCEKNKEEETDLS